MTISIRMAVLILAAGAIAAAQSSVRANLQPAHERKPAADFSLRDADGKTATLAQYRSKVLLLDFWATWCTGCKQEIPWFVDSQKKFGADRLAVVGVSMDEGGWGVLKPFLAQHPIPYRIVLGNDPTAQKFGIQSMPDTFLIDRQGRVAAAYLGGLVDRPNLEANLTTLLAER